MRIVFMGTPGFAAEILSSLISQHDVVAVYTRQDAVRGRGRKLIPSPVKQIAQKAGIPVYTPGSLKDETTQKQIVSLSPDVIVVAAYGMILPKAVLDCPPLGCLNVHASLLPRWRGAAPVERAILAGDKEVGVSIMRMEEGLDTGDYCVVRSTEIADKTSPDLSRELAVLGAQALLTALTLIDAGSVEWKHQDDFFSTYANKINKREFFLSPTDRASQSMLKVQASSPAHPARCIIASRTVSVLRTRKIEGFQLLDDLKHLHQGRVILFHKALYIGCFDQPLEVLELRPDGKRSMSGMQFATGVQNIKSGLITWDEIHV
ncbi:MAG: methionyl-tRNA formyltransferase [Eggerthellaceae bacterium]|jgi:methionyl-tRNA formyltransferase|nr:methionyl-tRNA formyltransferase [Eggerthellaceae bacterium]